MAKIGITLNEVMRDFLSQFVYTYEKYKLPKDEDYDKKVTEIDSMDFIEHFNKFRDIDDVNTFMFSEASLEIFGHADQIYENLMNKFNTFLSDIEFDEEHEIILISREANKSIPSTLFFLSKLGCRATNIKFVKKHEEKWDHVDILVTAHPKALESKPEGKKSIKINAPYNKEVSADFELDTIMELFDVDSIENEELRDGIIEGVFNYNVSK